MIWSPNRIHWKKCKITKQLKLTATASPPRTKAPFQRMPSDDAQWQANKY